MQKWTCSTPREIPFVLHALLILENASAKKYIYICIYSYMHIYYTYDEMFFVVREKYPWNSSDGTSNDVHLGRRGEGGRGNFTSLCSYYKKTTKNYHEQYKRRSLAFTGGQSGKWSVISGATVGFSGLPSRTAFLSIVAVLFLPYVSTPHSCFVSGFETIHPCLT